MPHERSEERHHLQVIVVWFVLSEPIQQADTANANRLNPVTEHSRGPMVALEEQSLIVGFGTPLCRNSVVTGGFGRASSCRHLLFCRRSEFLGPLQLLLGQFVLLVGRVSLFLSCLDLALGRVGLFFRCFGEAKRCGGLPVLKTKSPARQCQSKRRHDEDA